MAKEDDKRKRPAEEDEDFFLLDDEEEFLTETQMDNFERAALAVAVLYSTPLGVDIETQDEYAKLTPAQKTFAEKVIEDTPTLKKAVEADERLDERKIVEEVAGIAKRRGGAKKMKIVTVGDDKVCEKCGKWQDVEVWLDAEDGSPNLDEAIRDGFLHYGCRCALLDVGTAEIPLKEPNPRREERAAANPTAYQSAPKAEKPVLNKIVRTGVYFEL